jgi:hypothetical protein
METASTVPFNAWETVRYELLKTRICDLDLSIEGSRLEPLIGRLYRELGARQLSFEPPVYLTDTWGCPDQVPLMGIPFYLTDAHLARLEEEQTGEVEDDRTTMMFLRHEAGHAYNYAYRLWRRKGWKEVFGAFHRPYREVFFPQKTSRNFVRHILASQYGSTYAQKHPDEDFAETFAVWLAPRSGWRRRYRRWPAMRKLHYVDCLMHELRSKEPIALNGARVKPADAMTVTLAEFYGARADRYRAAAQGYVDDRLREAFSARANGGSRPVVPLLRKHRRELLARLTQWTGLSEGEVNAILSKVEERAAALRLTFPPRGGTPAVLKLAALATAFAMDFVYTGRFLD